MGMVQGSRMEDYYNSPFSNPLSAQQQSPMMYDYGKTIVASQLSTGVNTADKLATSKIKIVEEEEMVEKKAFGLKDATMVLFIGWILSKLVNRWTGKTFDELLGDYKAEFKEWLEK